VSKIKNKIFFSAAILLLFLLHSLPVSATEIQDITAVIDGDNNVTVSGKLVPGKAWQVTVKLTDPEGKLEYLDQTTSDAGGNFSFSYTMENLVEGVYLVSIGGEGITNPYVRELQATGIIDHDECFIATAAYGSKMDPGVTILRQFRDTKLLTNIPGQAFVSYYYSVSPSIAEYIAGNSLLKMLIRSLLLLLQPLISHSLARI